MKQTLYDIYREMNLAINGTSDYISPSNIDDILWYAKSKGITELSITPNQVQIIWQFLAANIGVSDTEMRREYFVEGKISRCLGIDFIILPYETLK